MKVKRGHIEFEVETSKFLRFWKLVNANRWEEETYDIIDHFVSEKDVMLDVGCSMGPITLYAAHHAKQVVAMDPDPVMYDELVKNLELNPSLQHKIVSLKMALTVHEGEFRLYAREHYGASSSSLLTRVRDKEKGLMVQGISLYTLLEQTSNTRFDFIKMDIEGGEFILLPELLPALQKLNFPTIFIAFHYLHLRENIYLKKLRLRLLSLVGMKIEDKTGIIFFRKSIMREIRKAIAPLRHYPFLYTHRGELLAFEELDNNPLLIKTSHLLATKFRWESPQTSEN